MKYIKNPGFSSHTRLGFLILHCLGLNFVLPLLKSVSRGSMPVKMERERRSKEVERGVRRALHQFPMREIVEKEPLFGRVIYYITTQTKPSPPLPTSLSLSLSLVPILTLPPSLIVHLAERIIFLRGSLSLSRCSPSPPRHLIAYFHEIIICVCINADDTYTYTPLYRIINILPLSIGG